MNCGHFGNKSTNFHLISWTTGESTTIDIFLGHTCFETLCFSLCGLSIYLILYAAHENCLTDGEQKSLSLTYSL